ncbi:hypothetical protein SteCoe_31133 [Stentor coeruleus]|uniref:Uncharacterized protein n=1 Tax=Stentor coeruleus TaxID=5963 RepID=A0A1R2B232_9CILI|nr:hypothetical protein SteCoe_31133 [Stentor coeruleus]
MLLIFLLTTIVNGDTSGTFNINGFTGTSGTISVNVLTGASIFYWQFTAQNGNITSDTRPLVIWTGGGPGCSSSLSYLMGGIAPVQINATGNLNNNPATWNTKVHLLAIDFPYDAGYSYSSQNSDLKNTTLDAINYLYLFLQDLSTDYPSWFKRDVYWFGEDYSGHFIPAIASLILQNNQNSKNNFIPLKGIAIDGPWLDGFYQTQYYDTSAYNLGIINSIQKNNLLQNEYSVLSMIQAGNYTDAFNLWRYTYGQFEFMTGNLSVYNVRTTSSLNITGISNYMNDANVKKTITNVPAGTKWVACDQDVYDAFGNDFMQGFVTTMMPGLLGQIKVMFIHGVDDLYTNTLGISQWIEALNWKYTSNFLQSRRNIWSVQGNIAGYVQTYSNLTYVQVSGASHSVGIEQPYAFRDSAFRFIFNQGWN